MNVLKGLIPFGLYFLIQALLWFFFLATETGVWLLLLFVLMLPVWVVYGLTVIFLDYQVGRLTIKFGQYQHTGVFLILSAVFAVLSASLYPIMGNLGSFLKWGRNWSFVETFKMLLPGFWGGDWFAFAHLCAHFLLFLMGMLGQRDKAYKKRE